MTYELTHHGILGQKWGVRRYQNEDGTLTEAGKKRYDYTKSKSYQNASDSEKKDRDRRYKRNRLITMSKKHANRIEYNIDQGLDPAKAFTKEYAGIVAKKAVMLSMSKAITKGKIWVRTNSYMGNMAATQYASLEELNEVKGGFAGPRQFANNVMAGKRFVEQLKAQGVA